MCVTGLQRKGCRGESEGYCGVCNAGSYVSGGGTNCTDCGAGTFSALENADSCTPCPPGHYQDQSGKSACKSCEAGRAAVDGEGSGGRSADYCVACPAGRYNPTPGELCQLCPNGTLCPQGATIFQPVEGGWYMRTVDGVLTKTSSCCWHENGVMLTTCS